MKDLTKKCLCNKIVTASNCGEVFFSIQVNGQMMISHAILLCSSVEFLLACLLVAGHHVTALVWASFLRLLWILQTD